MNMKRSLDQLNSNSNHLAFSSLNNDFDDLSQDEIDIPLSQMSNTSVMTQVILLYHSKFSSTNFFLLSFFLIE